MNRIINLKRVVDLGSEFITLTEAKTQLRVDFTDDDTEITALIKKARLLVENYCNISTVYQRIELIAVLEHDWKLPYGPVIGIESVLASTGATGSAPVSYATSTADWQFDGDQFLPGSTCARNKITYTAGNYCPDDLKQVILKVITHLYENRGRTSNEDDLKELLKEADNYKVMLWV